MKNTIRRALSVFVVLSASVAVLGGNASAEKKCNIYAVCMEQ